MRTRTLALLACSGAFLGCNQQGDDKRTRLFSDASSDEASAEGTASAEEWVVDGIDSFADGEGGDVIIKLPSIEALQRMKPSPTTEDVPVKDEANGLALTNNCYDTSQAKTDFVTVTLECASESDSLSHTLNLNLRGNHMISMQLPGCEGDPLQRDIQTFITQKSVSCNQVRMRIKFTKSENALVAAPYFLTQWAEGYDYDYSSKMRLYLTFDIPPPSASYAKGTCTGSAEVNILNRVGSKPKVNPLSCIPPKPNGDEQVIDGWTLPDAMEPSEP